MVVVTDGAHADSGATQDLVHASHRGPDAPDLSGALDIGESQDLSGFDRFVERAFAAIRCLGPFAFTSGGVLKGDPPGFHFLRHVVEGLSAEGWSGQYESQKKDVHVTGNSYC